MDDYYRRYRQPITTTFSAKLFSTALGLFDPLTFVVRVSPGIQKSLERATNRISAIFWSEEELLSAVVFLHETIHWWQYIGTSLGFTESLSVSVQGSSARRLLQIWSDQYGPRKPTTSAFREIYSKGTSSERQLLLNINQNWMDVELSSAVIHRPYLINGLHSEPYFKSLGRAILRHYVQTYAALEPILKDNFTKLPKVADWVNQGNMAAEAGAPDFTEDYLIPGTEITRPGFGAFEIMEGQARLSEIQYLSVFTHDRFNWQTCVKQGMLSEPYGMAFKYFITQTNLPWPDNSLAPSVGLFLLACDITLNPGEIYPFARFCPDTLVKSTHPSTRFERVTTAVSKIRSQLLHNFKYDDDAYLQMSSQLCAVIDEISPNLVAEEIIHLFDGIPGAKSILDGAPSNVFRLPSIPLKFYIWKHYTLMLDKIQHPAYFCWPAPCSVRMTLNYPQVFMRNTPPLISPSFDGKIMSTQSFYGDNSDLEHGLYDYLISQLLNDVIRQWIAKPGPFATSYDWIDPGRAPCLWQNIVRDYFKENFDFGIDQVKVIIR